MTSLTTSFNTIDFDALKRQVQGLRDFLRTSSEAQMSFAESAKKIAEDLTSVQEKSRQAASNLLALKDRNHTAGQAFNTIGAQSLTLQNLAEMADQFIKQAEKLLQQAKRNKQLTASFDQLIRNDFEPGLNLLQLIKELLFGDESEIRPPVSSPQNCPVLVQENNDTTEPPKKLLPELIRTFLSDNTSIRGETTTLVDFLTQFKESEISINGKAPGMRPVAQRAINFLKNNGFGTITIDEFQSNPQILERLKDPSQKLLSSFLTSLQRIL